MRDIANSPREFRSFHPSSNCILYRKWRLKKIAKVIQGISNSVNALKQVLISEILWKKGWGKPFGSSWYLSGKKVLSCSAASQPCADPALRSVFQTELSKPLPAQSTCTEVLLSSLTTTAFPYRHHLLKRVILATPAKRNWKYFMLLILHTSRQEHYPCAAFISPEWCKIKTQHSPATGAPGCSCTQHIPLALGAQLCSALQSSHLDSNCILKGKQCFPSSFLSFPKEYYLKKKNLSLCC